MIRAIGQPAKVSSCCDFRQFRHNELRPLQEPRDQNLLFCNSRMRRRMVLLCTEFVGTNPTFNCFCTWPVQGSAKRISHKQVIVEAFGFRV